MAQDLGSLALPKLALSTWSIEDSYSNEHCNIEQLRHEHGPVLGKGNSAVVVKVQDQKTRQIFARKTISRRFRLEKVWKEKDFRREIKVLKLLSGHHHIIRLCAYYVEKKEFCIILQPAADEGSLDEYLGRFLDFADHPALLDEDANKMISCLEQAFGCLASGLAYMHQKKVKHKDIKPHNILIHQGSVVFADFGASKDVSPGETTTQGPVEDGQTRKYSPPEVLASSKRSFSGDVWSLGCVYIEILVALKPNLGMNTRKCFAESIQDLHEQLWIDSDELSWTLSGLPPLVVTMTSQDRISRPTAKDVMISLASNPRFACESCHQEASINIVDLAEPQNQ